MSETPTASLFQLGDFKLHSGSISRFKIECDSLTDKDLECLAYLLSERLRSFGSVEGVPRGGLRLAEKMRKYITSGPILIVDDVLTTGTSMNACRSDRNAIGAVLFARSGSVPGWITPLFRMGPALVHGARYSRRVEQLEDAITEAGIILANAELGEGPELAIRDAVKRLGSVMADPAALKRQGI